ncbi:tetratricopeptide repeat protein [Sphaerimonospora cavernae]|uniref:Tetratricopeptide repeat protein n=1 Tax=Sphaerimonospora cavernae TaxID=1740611 RepID=A0ABV6U771_9ACTN
MSIGHLIRQYQDLAAERPESFEWFDADVVRALGDLCARLDDDDIAGPEQLVIEVPAFVEAELLGWLGALGDRLASRDRAADERDVRRLALNLHRRTGDEFAIAVAMSRLASPLTALGDLKEALALRRQAFDGMIRLARRREAPRREDRLREDRRSEARWRAATAEAEPLAELLVRLDRPLAALRVADRLVKALDPLEEEWSAEPYALALRLRARMLSQTGSHAEAVTVAEKAVEWFRHVGVSFEVAFTLNILSDIHHLAGDLTAALEASRQALDAARDDPSDQVTLGLAWGGLAVRHGNLGQWAQARDCLDEALALDAPRSDLRAAHLRRLSDVLGRLQEVEEALEVMLEAVDIDRDLVAADPGRHLPDLAIDLVNLGIRYTAAGRGAKAVYATEEAVKHYRDLVERDGSHAVNLAQAYGCLAERLAENGQAARAATEAKRSAELYRQAGDPRLADALRALGTYLHTDGDHDASAAAMADAIDLFRTAGDLPGLAHVLFNAAVTSRVCGRIDDALARARESAEIYQRLYDEGGAEWDLDLADALRLLGGIWEEARQFEHAITSLDRAVSLLERAYRPGDTDRGEQLAATLHSLSRYHEMTDRLDRSLTLMRRSVSLYGELIQHDPVGFRSRLASAWLSLGVYLWRTGGLDECLSTLRLSVDLYREAGDRAGLAHALRMLSDRTAEAAGDEHGDEHGDTGENDDEDALGMLHEAMEILEDLALQRPEPYLPKLAKTIDSLAERLCEKGAHREALPHTERAADIWAGLGDTDRLVGSLHRRLFILTCLGRDTEATVERLTEVQEDLTHTVRTLNDVAQELLGIGLLDHARRHLDRAAALWEIHVIQHPDADSMPYAHVLDSMATLLSRQGSPGEAAAAQREVVEIFEAGASADPDVFLGALAVVLDRLGGYLRDAGRDLDALPYQRRCVEIMERRAAHDPSHRPSLVTALDHLGELLTVLGHAEADAVRDRTATLRAALPTED